MLNKKSKRDVVINAVERAKASEFGVTGVKQELEAQLERNNGSEFESVNDCYAWIMERLQKLGLAEFREGEYHSLSEHDESQVETEWYPIWPLTYADFYDDGSVDSELTYTLALDNPENIYLQPKIVQIWKDFMAAVENDTGFTPDMSGAGMHTAFINTRHCTYPSRFGGGHIARFDNFKRSMGLLLPSLYFLASSDETSRPMQYREPKIEMYNGGRGWSTRTEQKFCAITYNQGALEYRIFNTCYDNPDVCLDNFVVMVNTLKYWKSNYRDPGLAKITRRTHFGNDAGRDLGRLYVTVEHVDLLNEGLKRLKPSYYSIKELKAQRSFRVSKRSITGMLARLKREALLQYKEYEARSRFELQTYRFSLMRDFVENKMYDTRGHLSTLNEDEIIAEAQKYADERVAHQQASHLSRDAFIEERVNSGMRTEGRARWELVGA